MALNDVEVNYTMMLQEKDEFIKVLQMQVNILKKKFDENMDKLIGADDEDENARTAKVAPENKSSKEEASVDLNEFNALKEKNVKMTSLLGNCKATILKHREEIKELSEQNKMLQENSADTSDVSLMKATLSSKISSLETDLETTLKNNKQLVKNMTALKADHDALTSKFNEATNILNEDIRLLIVQKTDLESKYENLAEENGSLVKKIEALNKELQIELNEKVELEKKTEYLDKLLKQHETSLATWKEKIISSIDHFSSSTDRHIANSSSSDSGAASSLSATETTVHFELNSDGNIDNEFNDIYNKVVRNFTKVSEDKKRSATIGFQTDSHEEGDDKFSQKFLQDSEGLIEKLRCEKRALKKFLTKSQVKAKIFKQLCNSIFQSAVTEFDQNGDVILSENVLNSNLIDVNNFNGFEIPPVSKNDLFGQEEFYSSKPATTTTNNISHCHLSCPAHPSEPRLNYDCNMTTSNNIPADTPWYGYSNARLESSFTVRQSIIAILKDGLNRALIKMENDKKNKFQKSSSLLSKEAAPHKNNKSDEGSLDSTSSSDCYPTTTTSSTSIENSLTYQSNLSSETLVNSADDNDDEWESVDEEYDDDETINSNVKENIGRRNKFDVNSVSSEDSLKELLEGWKTSCEQVQSHVSLLQQQQLQQSSYNVNSRYSCQGVDHVELLLTKSASTVNVLADIPATSDQSEVESMKNELTYHYDKYNTLLRDYDNLFNDFTLIKNDYEIQKQTCDILKVENTEMSDIINKLKSTSETDSASKSQIQDNYDHIVHNLDQIRAEKIDLQLELTNVNDLYDQQQRDYNEVREQLERALNDNRKLELDMNVLNNVHNDVKDEHDKLTTLFSNLEADFIRVTDSLTKLQQEHSHLQDDHKMLQIEIQELKENEIRSDDKYNELKLNYDQVGSEIEKIKIENVESIKDCEKINADYNSLKASYDTLKQDYEKLVDDHDKMKNLKVNMDETIQNLLNSENELNSKLLILETTNKELLKKFESKNETGELLSKKIEECENIRNKLSKAEEDYDKLQIEMEMLRCSSKKSLEDYDALDDKYHKIFEEKEIDLLKIAQLENQLLEHRAEVNDAELKKAEFQSVLNLKENEIKKLTNSINELDSLNKQLNNQINKLQLESIEMHNLIVEKDVKIEELNDQVDALKKQLDVGRIQQKNSSQEIDRYKDELKKLHDVLKVSSGELSEKCRNLEVEISKLMNDLLETKSEKNKMAVKLEESEKTISECSKINADQLACLKEVEKQLSEKSDFCEILKISLSEEKQTYDAIVNDLNNEVKELRDKFETAELDRSNHLKEVMQKSEVELSNVRTNLSAEIETLRASNDAYIEDIKAKNIIIDQLNKTLADMKIDFEKKYSELKTNETKLMEHMKELNGYKSSIEQLKTDNEVSVSKFSNEIENLKQLIIEKDEAINELNLRHSEKVEELTKNETLLNEKIEIFNQEKLKSIHELRDNYENELNLIKKEIDAKNSKISELDKEVSDKDVMIGSLKIELDTKEIKLSCFELEFDNLQSELSQRSSEKNLLQERSDGLEDLKLTVLNINKELDEKSKENELLKKEVENLKTSLSEKLLDYEKLQETFKTTKQDWIEKNNELKKKAEAKLKQLKKQRTDADELVTELTNSLTSCKDEISKLNDELASANTSLSLKEGRIIELNDKIIGYDDKESQFNDKILTLEEMADDLKEELVAKNNEIANYKEEIVISEMKIKELNEQISMKLIEHDSCLNELSNVKMNVKTLEDCLSKKELELTENMYTVNLLRQELTNSEQRVFQLECTFKRESEEKLQLQKKLNNAYEESVNVVKKSDIEMELVKSEVKELKNYQTTADNELLTLRNEKESLIEEVEIVKKQNSEALSNLQLKNQSLLTDNESLNKEVNDLKLEIVSLKEVIDRLTEEKNKLLELTKPNGPDDEKVSIDRLERLEKDLNEVTTDRDILKRKVQSLQQEVKKLKTELESSLKSAEDDKQKEIERLRREYTDEMKERDDENDVRVKQMLREFQVKMEEKEKQYQDNFTISLEKFEDESRDRLNELHDEIEELKNDLKMKDEYIDEQGSQIDDLKIIMSRMHAEDEWKDLKERENELETEIQMLNHQLNHFQQKQDGSSNVEDEVIHTAVYKMENQAAPPSQQLQPSSSSSLSQIVSIEFEYLKTILYKYMTGTPDKQTLARVICKIMKYAEHEEKEILGANKR